MHSQWSSEEPLKRRCRLSLFLVCSPYLLLLQNLFDSVVSSFMLSAFSWRQEFTLWCCVPMLIGSFVSSILEERIYTGSLTLDLPDSSDHVYLQQWQMNQSSTKSRCVLKMRISEILPWAGLALGSYCLCLRSSWYYRMYPSSWPLFKSFWARSGGTCYNSSCGGGIGRRIMIQGHPGKNMGDHGKIKQKGLVEW
jgi:hypothetical protein